jgi:hypothetical protein
MSLFSRFSRLAGFSAALCLMLATLACGGKSGGSSTTAANNATLTGTISFTRVPLIKDAAGVPTGLETNPANFISSPARGVEVRLLRNSGQIDGSGKVVWILIARTVTDVNGKYTIVAQKDYFYTIEVLSQTNAGGGVNVVADQINSTANQANRKRYTLHKAPDGTSSTMSPTPSSVLSADTNVDFAVGVNDQWWVEDTSLISGTATQAPGINGASLEVPGNGTGSRVLGILDTQYTFASVYGNTTPGATLDLHYKVGFSEAKGSYIEYDRSLHPESYDPSTNTRHYFGSIRGGLGNDDAWDEGVIYPLLARANLFYVSLFIYYGRGIDPINTPLNNLSQSFALIEGFPNAMAANLLRSPYLADTTSGAPIIKDVRDLSTLTPTQKSLYSAQTIAALSWELTLKANGVTSPGNAAAWAGMNSTAMPRFFGLRAPTDGSDTGSLFQQIARLKEAKSTSEPVDLAAVFTDPVLTSLLAPFNVPWTRPTTGPLSIFIKDWGTDPLSIIAPLSFTMTNAEKVSGVFPNVSQGEVAFGKFVLNSDRAFKVSAIITPPLPSSAKLEIVFLSQNASALSGNSIPPTRVVLFTGTQALVIRLRTDATVTSPLPDFTVNLSLVPTN